MRILAALLAGLVAASYAVHSLDIDMPPRPARVARLWRCDHCGERECAWWCEHCGLAYCCECEPAHESHAGVL